MGNTSKVGTIAERNPEAWSKIEYAGFTSLSEMAKRMTSASMMDAALGYRSATSKWSRGAGMPGPEAERRAREWLNKGKGTQTDPTSSGADMLLVVCPDGVSAKARRLLAVLGCEVEAL